MQLRREQYESIKNDLESPSVDDMYLVPTEWLRGWITGIYKQDTVPNTSTSQKDNNSNYPVVDDKIHDLTVESDEDVNICESTVPPVQQNVSLVHQGVFNEPITNLENLCQHKTGLKPSSLLKYKAISSIAYHTICSSLQNGGQSNYCDYELNYKTAICQTCLSAFREATSNVSSIYSKFNTIIDQLDKRDRLDDISIRDEEYFILEKAWIVQLRKICEKLLKSLNFGSRSVANGKIDSFFGNESKANAIDITTVENGDGEKSLSSALAYEIKTFTNQIINEGITCQHNKLIPSYKRRSRVISIETWNIIQNTFTQTKEYLSTDEICPICLSYEEIETDIKKEEKIKRNNQITEKCLHMLYSRKNKYPHELTNVTDAFTNSSNDKR
jgi:hypothetical protein